MFPLMMWTRRGQSVVDLLLILFTCLQIGNLQAQTDHPGSCPVVTNSTGADCTELCSSDADCPSSDKCCSNGCGRECIGALFKDYSLSFTLVEEWREDLSESSSNFYRELATNITIWVECAFNASDFTITVNVSGFSQTNDYKISVSLTLTTERPVSTAEIIIPLNGYTNGFTTLETYSIEGLQISRHIQSTTTGAPTTSDATTQSPATEVTSQAATTTEGTSTTQLMDTTQATKGTVSCTGSWTEVPQLMVMSWTLDDTDITFNISINGTLNSSMWMGVGISEDHWMPGSDIYTIRVDGQTVTVEDRWASGHFKPALEQSQDITDSAIRIVDNITYISFMRPLRTGDPYDRDVIGCHYFLFAVGPLNAERTDISYHTESKTTSTEKICIEECGATTISMSASTSVTMTTHSSTNITEVTTQTIATDSTTSSVSPETTGTVSTTTLTTTATTIDYERISVRGQFTITNQNYIPELGDKNSTTYQSNAETVKSLLAEHISLDGRLIAITDITFSSGSLVVAFTAEYRHDGSDIAFALTNIMRTIAEADAILGISIDPDSIVVNALTPGQEESTLPTNTTSGPSTETMTTVSTSMATEAPDNTTSQISTAPNLVTTTTPTSTVTMETTSVSTTKSSVENLTETTSLTEPTPEMNTTIMTNTTSDTYTTSATTEAYDVIQIRGYFTITNRQFNETLGDKTSDFYKSTSQLFKAVLEENLSLNGLLIEITDITFSNGSVVVSFLANYRDNGTDLATTVKQALIDAANNDHFGNFAVDINSISIEVVMTETDGTTSAMTTEPVTTSSKASVTTISVSSSESSTESTPAMPANGTSNTTVSESTTVIMVTNTTVEMTTESVTSRTESLTTEEGITNATSEMSTIDSVSPSTEIVTTSESPLTTSAETSTNVTTPAPVVQIQSSFRVSNRNWDPYYANKTSQLYYTLYEIVLREMKKLFGDSLHRITNVSFREGSVIVEFEAEFYQSAVIPDMGDEVSTIIKEAAENQMFEDLLVDSNSVQSSVVKTETNGTTSAMTTEPVTTSSKAPITTISVSSTESSTESTSAIPANATSNTTVSESTTVIMVTNTTIEMTTESVTSRTESLTTEEGITNATSEMLTTDSMSPSTEISTTSESTPTTSAETSTNMTTPAPVVQIQSSFKVLNRSWDPDYADITSQLYYTLYEIVLREMTKLFGDILHRISNVSFREGSVIVELEAEFYQSAVIPDMGEEVSSIIKEAAENETLVDLLVDPNSVQSSVITPSTTSSFVTMTTLVPVYTATVTGELTITGGAAFHPDLLNKSSPAYEILKQQLDAALQASINRVYPGRYRGIYSMDFSEGSVKVSYTAEIEDSAMSPVTEMGVLQGITKALDIGEFGNFTVDPASVKAKVSSTLMPTPTSPVITTTPSVSQTSSSVPIISTMSSSETVILSQSVTLSSTVSPSLTIIPSLSMTLSSAVSPSLTVISSPPLTVSSTVSPSMTVITSPPVTPSSTASPSFTMVPSPSVIFSTTVSPEISPSLSETLSSTVSSSLTVISSPPVTPSSTASPSLTVTTSPPVTPSSRSSPFFTMIPSPSVVLSTTVSPGVTVSPSISETLSSAMSSTVTVILSPSTTLNLTVSTSSSVILSPSMTPSSTVSPSVPIISSPIVSSSSEVSSSITIVPSQPVTSSSSATQSFSSTGSPSVSLTPTSSLSPSPTILPSTTVEMNSSSLLSPSVSPASPSVSETVTSMPTSTVLPSTSSISISPTPTSIVSPSVTVTPSKTVTVTPSVTVTPTGTTPTTPSVTTVEFYGAFSIPDDTLWNPNLSDSTSPEYTVKKGQIDLALNSSFMAHQSLRNRFSGTKEMVFVRGSVNVSYIVIFKVNKTSTIEASTVNQAVLDGIDNNLFPFVIDRATVTHQVEPFTTPEPQSTEPVTMPATSTEKPAVLPNWAIAVIACGAAVLLFLLVMICVLCRRRHVTHKYALEDPDDIGYRRQINAEGSPFHVYDNKTYEDLADGEEIKPPAAFYTLSDNSLREGNGQARTGSPNGSSNDPNKTTIL